jgi:hypothetical protein
MFETIPCCSKIIQPIGNTTEVAKNRSNKLANLYFMKDLMFVLIYKRNFGFENKMYCRKHPTVTRDNVSQLLPPRTSCGLSLDAVFHYPRSLRAITRRFWHVRLACRRESKYGQCESATITCLRCLDDWRGGTGLSQGPSGRAISGCLTRAKAGLLAEKMRTEAEAATKAKGSGDRSTGGAWALPKGGNCGLLEGPQNHRRQAQSKRVGLVRLGQFTG